jgi:hypothetical protein
MQRSVTCTVPVYLSRNSGFTCFSFPAAALLDSYIAHTMSEPAADWSPAVLRGACRPMAGGGAAAGSSSGAGGMDEG